MSTTVENGQRTTAESNLQTEYVAPEVNIFETEDGYVVEAEMPGVNKEGLEITVEGNEVVAAMAEFEKFFSKQEEELVP